MPAPNPIQLGSAVGTGWTFESGSNVSTDQYGIQTCAVRALFPQGDSVLTSIPAEGSSFNTVFGNSYLPSSFLLDFFEGTPSVEYQDGRVARVTFKFKRQDPIWGNRRTISPDTVLNYDSIFNQKSMSVVGLGGVGSVAPLDQLRTDKFGFPEPTVSVKYSTTTSPSIGTGDLSTLYALPGSSKAAGFPIAGDVFVPTTLPVPAGATVAYFDGAAVQAVTVTVDTTFYFQTHYKSHPKGWQLTNLKYDPISNFNFFAVEETWRTYYFFNGVQFIGKSP
jgi:hypothetical protein